MVLMIQGVKSKSWLDSIDAKVGGCNELAQVKCKDVQVSGSVRQGDGVRKICEHTCCAHLLHGM